MPTSYHGSLQPNVFSTGFNEENPLQGKPSPRIIDRKLIGAVRLENFPFGALALRGVEGLRMKLWGFGGGLAVFFFVFFFGGRYESFQRTLSCFLVVVFR